MVHQNNDKQCSQNQYVYNDFTIPFTPNTNRFWCNSSVLGGWGRAKEYAGINILQFTVDTPWNRIIKHHTTDGKVCKLTLMTWSMCAVSFFPSACVPFTVYYMFIIDLVDLVKVNISNLPRYFLTFLPIPSSSVPSSDKISGLDMVSLSESMQYH